MRTALSLADFLAHRVGSALRTRHWSYVVPRADLSIGVAVGRFDQEDLHALVPLLEAVRSFPPHVAIWDTSRIEDVSADAFGDLERFFVERFRNQLTVQKVAIIAPPSGPLRATAAGMFALLDPPYPASAFANIEDALAWLAIPCGEFPALVESEAAALVENAFDDVVCAWLEGHLMNPDVDRCARDLRVSVRTLQRRLRELDTSFAEETTRARVRAAEERLKTEASLTEIAYEIGFSSPQRFASVFREVKGETPSEARKRMRLASTNK